MALSTMWRRLLRSSGAALTSRRTIPSRSFSSVTEDLTMPEEDCPVCVYNEWDPLEEIIVGRAEGACVPTLRPEVKAILRTEYYDYFKEAGGTAHQQELIDASAREIDEFVRVLEGEGVTVKRPDLIEWSRVGAYRTPDWTEQTGFSMACPRDSMTVIGNEILEAPMAWRARYFETRPYKTLLNEYFEKGARWTQAPKPTMNDECYREDFEYENETQRKLEVAQGKYVLTEAEPMFDAAEIQRVGRDIFLQISNTTNFKGLEWMKRHFGRQGYRVHGVNCMDTHAIHVDCTLVFLKPGLCLSNPTRPCLQEDLIRKAGWDVYHCPPPTETPNDLVYSSAWLSMNVLMLDEHRAILYNKEEALKKFFEEKCGIKTIGVDMTTAFGFGGAFHCWTLDVKRRGKLEDYGFGKVDFDAGLKRHFDPAWHETQYKAE